MSDGLIDFLSKYLTPERKLLFNNILENRTKYFSVVLEDIYQPQNASAVLRSCDCFGVQNINVIENNNKFRISDNVALGSSKWLSITKYNNRADNTYECLQNLKKEGYRIVATSPSESATSLYNLDLNKGKAALVFGTELTGVSKCVKENADEVINIPMFGFTESFNISVSAAIVLHYLTLKLRTSTIHWKLSDIEKQEIKLEWIRKTVKKAELLGKFINNKKIR